MAMVYRIEDAAGLGPFQSEEARQAIDANTYNWNAEEYPTPANDPGFDQDDLWDFVEKHRDDQLPSVGCCSREQLQHWFDAAKCSALAALGYFLSVFEVADDNVFVGDFQAVFGRRNAKLIEQLPACALWQTEPQLTLPLAA